jgi:uncharacterized spore protein YtfJ
MAAAIIVLVQLLFRVVLKLLSAADPKKKNSQKTRQNERRFTYERSNQHRGSSARRLKKSVIWWMSVPSSANRYMWIACFIIPVSKVTYGFASGGSDFSSKTNQDLFGGGGGAGITINPVAFLIVSDGEVTIKHIAGGDGSASSAERIIGMVPEVVDKVSAVINKFVKEKSPDEDAPSDAE